VIVERKRKPDGTVREYACEFVMRSGGLMVVRFRMVKGGTIFGTPIEVPPGSVSYGYFWASRPYNLYRMFRADGSLMRRFDAVTDVRLLDGAVEYRDLVLDWWVLPDDTIIEEDREEMEALSEIGVLSAEDVAKANRAAYQVLSRYRHVIDEAVEVEAARGFRRD
jgi:predicted RNA-binding protein associated with RNAse of E/G family